MNDPRLQAFIQSLILSVLIVIAFASFSSDAAPPPLAGGSSEFEERIARLEVSVGKLLTARATPSAHAAAANPGPRTLVEAESFEVSEALRQELDQLRRMISYSQPDVVSQHSFQFEKVRHSPPTNSRALQALQKKLASDDEGIANRVRRGLLYSTQDEVLQRFGRPTSISAGESPQERFVNYVGEGYEIQFQFLNGHVVELD